MMVRLFFSQSRIQANIPRFRFFSHPRTLPRSLQVQDQEQDPLCLVGSRGERPTGKQILHIQPSHQGRQRPPRLSQLRHGCQGLLRRR